MMKLIKTVLPVLIFCTMHLIYGSAALPSNIDNLDKKSHVELLNNLPLPILKNICGEITPTYGQAIKTAKTPEDKYKIMNAAYQEVSKDWDKDKQKAKLILEQLQAQGLPERLAFDVSYRIELIKQSIEINERASKFVNVEVQTREVVRRIKQEEQELLNLLKQLDALAIDLQAKELKEITALKLRSQNEADNKGVLNPSENIELPALENYFKFTVTPTFNQAWEKCEKNSDRIIVFEKALDAIEKEKNKEVAKKQATALKALLVEQNFLDYIKNNLSGRIAAILSKD